MTDKIIFVPKTVYEDGDARSQRNLQYAINCLGTDEKNRTDFCEKFQKEVEGIEPRTHEISYNSEENINGVETKKTYLEKIGLFSTDEYDFDGDGKLDRLVVADAKLNGTHFLMVAIVSDILNTDKAATSVKANLLFSNKPVITKELDKKLVSPNLEDFVSPGLSLLKGPAVNFGAIDSGISGAVKVFVKDLNNDGVPDISIETGKKVGNQVEIRQFISNKVTE